MHYEISKYRLSLLRQLCIRNKTSEEKKLELCSLHVLKKFSLSSFRLCQENPKIIANALLVSIFRVMSISDVSMSIAIQNIVLSFDSVDGIVAIQKKIFQQYFLMVIFIFHFFAHLNLVVAWKNSRHLATPPGWFPRQMTSEKRTQKFYTDDASLPRSG